MNGIEILKQVKIIEPNLPVLILTIMDEGQISMRVLQAGASGFMTKNTMPKELTTAVNKIYSGGRYISSLLAEKLVFDLFIEDEKPLHIKLSNREYQVLCMIGSGKSIKQIAEELYLSEQTVRTYRMRILEKMNVTTNAELIHYTIQHNLVDPISN